MFKKLLLVISLIFPASLFAAQIKIGDAYSLIPRFHEPLYIYADSVDYEIGGFRFVIAFDESRVEMLDVQPGHFLDSCEWEYFTWRTYTDDALPIDINPSTSLLEIYGLASINGNYQPVCYASDNRKELVKMTVMVPLDDPVNNIDCGVIYLPFYWRDCDDNIIYSRNSDTVYSAGQHYNWYDYYYIPPLDSFELYVDTAHYGFPGYGIDGAVCDTLSSASDIANVSIVNGLFDIPCFDWGMASYGDLNLNGKGFEPGDLVLYSNYFLYGVSVFTINTEGQIYASDFNNDGLALTITDFYFGLHVLAESQIPYKISLPENTIGTVSKITHTNDLEFNSNNDIGAVYLKLITDDGTILTKNDFSYLSESAQLGFVGDTTTILLANMDATPVFTTGENTIFDGCKTHYTITHIEAVDIAGRNVTINDRTRLPQSFDLAQNYPNPFNPTTTIQASLPHLADWTLNIFNINGQKIRTFSGNNQGNIDIIWDGTDSWGNTVSSGVYLYKFSADGYSANRKMLLLK